MTRAEDESASPTTGGRGGQAFPADALRCIVGNLDAERSWALDDAEGRRAAGDAAASLQERAISAPRLPQRVLASVSACATLLRAFAHEGDVLWTPAAVASERLPETSALPAPRLVTGALGGVGPYPLLAWGETLEVASARRREEKAASSDAGLAMDASAFLLDGPPAGGIVETIRALAPPSPAAARRANNRALALDVARDLGVALPGARIIRSVAELADHLRAAGAAAARGGHWVVKAPFSASARERLRGSGTRLDGPSLRRAERLLESYGRLLFEPWMERTCDVGRVAIIDGSRLRVLPLHGLLVAPNGVFRGVELAGPERAPRGLEALEDSSYRCVEAVAQRLRSLGYSGPFGVDAWQYRGTDGEVRFHPLGEINARMTFGLVARALVERLTAGGALRRDAELRFRIATSGEHALHLEAAPSSRRVPLLEPSGDDPTCAWIEPAASP